MLNDVIKGDVDLVEVASVLPAYLHKGMPFERFNKMQSNCLEAWNSDSNLLVSAPTGSGKTVCFELAILREVHKVVGLLETKHLGSNGLGRKFVFIAPTKALCSEKADSWRERFGYLGLQVEMITGDVDSSTADFRLQKADLLLTTAEKWDSITRNRNIESSSDVAGQIALLLLDEVHQLGDSRGSTFESVVTRMLVASDESKRQASAFGALTPVGALRVVAVSATIQNCEEVAAWLRVPPDCLKQFDQSYRPVALEFTAIGYYIRNRWQSAKVFDDGILNVLKQFGGGKPALVFCPSRRQCGLSAEAMVERLQNPGISVIEVGNVLTNNLKVQERRDLGREAAKCKDSSLASLLRNGVAVHNAEMTPENRRLVERLFRLSLIQCLFSTSTLAQGVNLPARLVVIAGTAVYHDGSLQEYDRNIMMQMCGRAGRPGLDTRGVAVIMTAKATVQQYENLDSFPPSEICSQLESKLEESLNAEIARQFVTDIPSAVFFLTNTFFCVRSQKMYEKECGNNPEKLRANIRSKAVATVDALSKMNLVRFDDDCYGVSSTAVGICMAKYCISFKAMQQLTRDIPNAVTPSQVLRMIATCPDAVQGICVRRSEKRMLNSINELIRFPIRGKVKEPTDKIVVLLQMVMGDVEARGVDFSLRSEALRLVENVSRVCSCILLLSVEQAIETPYQAQKAILQVCRGLLNRCFWDGPNPLRQIPEVTPVVVKALVKSGLGTIASVAEAECSRLDKVVPSTARFGQRVLDRLKSFPKFHVEIVVQCEEASERKSRQIEVRVALSAQVGHWKPSHMQRGEGFVLVGSHSVGLVGSTRFKLRDGDQKLFFPVRRANWPRRGQWMDVIVGSDVYPGLDVSARLDFDMMNDDRAMKSRTVAANPCGQRRQASTVGRRLTLESSRLSKRLKQTKFPRMLVGTVDELLGSKVGKARAVQHTSPEVAPGVAKTCAIIPKACSPKRTGNVEERLKVKDSESNGQEDGSNDGAETDVSLENVAVAQLVRLSYAKQKDTHEADASFENVPIAQLSKLKRMNKHGVEREVCVKKAEIVRPSQAKDGQEVGSHSKQDMHAATSSLNIGREYDDVFRNLF